LRSLPHLPAISSTRRERQVLSRREANIRPDWRKAGSEKVWSSGVRRWTPRDGIGAQTKERFDLYGLHLDINRATIQPESKLTGGSALLEGSHLFK
jgi:hypothetical protein